MSQTPHPWLSTYEALGKDWHAVPEVPPLTLSGYVREYAKEFGGREALVFLGKGSSYSALDRLSDRMANLRGRA